MKKNTLILAAALTLALSLTACGGKVITKTPDSLNQQGQTAASDSKAPASERTATGTMLLDGKETTVYPEVSDTEINFWDSASGGKLLAVAKYPETLAGAAKALKGCDYTDLDEDGNRLHSYSNRKSMNSSEPDANAISKERVIWTHHGSDFHPRFNTERTLRCFAGHQRLFRH